MNARLTLKAIQQGQAQKTYALTAGAGANGQALVIQAAKGTRYQLTDALTFTSPEKLQIKRVGSDLLIALPGNDVSSPDIVIRGYFAFEDMALSGLAPNGQPMIYDTSGSLLSAITQVAPAGITATSLLPDQTLSAGLAKGTQGWFDSAWGLGALAAGGLALAAASKSGGGSTPASSTNPGLAKIIAYNTTPNSPAPLEGDFVQAGISGVNSTNLSGILSILSKTQLSLTAANVQSLVNSFIKVVAEANGVSEDATPSADPAVGDYANLIGAINTPPSLFRKSAAVSLVNDRLKTLSPSEVETQTYSALKKLVDAADTISRLAESSPSTNGTSTAGLTVDDHLKPLLGPDVTATSLSAVSDAIRHAPDDLSTLNTMARLSALVKAYNVILAEANGSSTQDTTEANPTAADYAAVHANIGSASTDAAALARLNALVSQLPSTSVDTVAEINRLALALDKVQALAALETGAALSDAQKLSADELRTLGLSGFTGTEIQNAELAQQVSKKIRDSEPAEVVADVTGKGSGMVIKDPVAGLKTPFEQTQLQRLQSLVSLEIIKSYQVDSSTNTAKSVVPSLDDWTSIGVFKPIDSGSNTWQSLNKDDLSYINSAADKLGPEALGSREDAQAVVNAYVRIIQEANGALADANTTINASHEDLARVGVTGAVTTKDSRAFALMLDVISNSGSSAVDTVNELQALANTVGKIMQASQDATPTFNTAELGALGLRGVTDSNRDDITAALRQTAAEGKDTVAELQSLVSGIRIQRFADPNDDTAPRIDKTDYEAMGLKFSELWSGYTFDSATDRGSLALNLMTDAIAKLGASQVDSLDELKGLAIAAKTLVDLAAKPNDAEPQTDPIANANAAIVYAGPIPGDFTTQLARLGLANVAKLDDGQFHANTAGVSKEKDNVWASIQDLNVDAGLTYDAIQAIVSKYAY